MILILCTNIYNETLYFIYDIDIKHVSSDATDEYFDQVINVNIFSGEILMHKINNITF